MEIVIIIMAIACCIGAIVACIGSCTWVINRQVRKMNTCSLGELYAVKYDRIKLPSMKETKRREEQDRYL